MRILLHSISLPIGAALLSLFFSWITYLPSVSHLVPGLDAAYTYGFNYAFLNKLIMGHDIVFTFGPLGFLEHTRLLANSMIYISAAFWLIVSIILNYCLLIFSWQSSDRWSMRWLNMAAGILLVLVVSPYIQRLLLIPAVCFFLYWRSHAVSYLLLFALATAVCLLIKFSYGVAALSLLLPYLVSLALRDKSLRAPMIGVVTVLVVYFGLWLMIYGGLIGSLGYLRAGLQFAQGSSTAMALNPDNNWVAMFALYAAVLAALFAICREWGDGIAVAPLAFLGPMYIWSKYAFGVEDPSHLAFLISWIFYALILWLIAARDMKQKKLHAVVLIFAFFAWTQLHTEDIGEPEYSLAPNFGLSNQHPFANPLDLDKHIADMREAEHERIKDLLLPESIRNTVGFSPVDIYPWETVIAAANHLNWMPRPVFQNYITYTPYLDAKNQNYLSSNGAPEFIIWHKHSFQDIGTRYPFNTDPLTLAAILNHYQPVECAENICLWKKTLHEQTISVLSDNMIDLHWDEWLSVPDMKANIIKAHVDVKRNTLGKLNLLAWKEGGIYIDYRLLDGSIKTHELPPDNAVSGVWVSPYLQGVITKMTTDDLMPNQVKPLLSALPGKGYFDKVEKTALGLHVQGWCLIPFESTEEQKLSVLLYNEQHAYRVSVVSRERRDVTDSLNMRGVVDLDMAGFDHYIETRGMVPGDYYLRVLVDNKGKTAIAPEQHLHVNVSPPTNTGNVEAIRIRTTRPWAFADTLSVNWEVVRFTGKAPF